MFKIFSHMCSIGNMYLEKAVAALGRVNSGYPVKGSISGF